MKNAEKSKAGVNVRELVVMAVLSAVLLAGQVALAPIPNVEIVSLLIYIYTQVYRRKVFFIIYVFVLLEGCVYGFGLWWLGYLYVWSVLAVIVLLLKKTEQEMSVLLCSIVLGAYGLAYGFLFAIPYFFLSGAAAGTAYWISGIPFDVIHCIGNAVVAAILYKPLKSLISYCTYRIT